MCCVMLIERRGGVEAEACVGTCNLSVSLVFFSL